MEFSYSTWRHGGWYVHEVRYSTGACGCVSRNYPDKKWRIACDPRPFDEAPTFPNRDAAAAAEYELAARERAIAEEVALMDDLELALVLARRPEGHEAHWRHGHAKTAAFDRAAEKRLALGPWPGKQPWDNDMAGAMMRLVRDKRAVETHGAMDAQGRTFEAVVA